MRRVVSSSEIVSTCEWQGRMIDVSAHSDAYFDEATSTLRVNLSSLAEPADIEFHPDWQKPDWLPAEQTVEEHVSYGEALEAAKEIFRVWARKVREIVPRKSGLNTERSGV